MTPIIDYSLYELNPLMSLNRYSKMDQRAGVFLRLNGKYFMDYHPWLEFGDLSRVDFLSSILNFGLDEKTIAMFELDRGRHEIRKLPFLNHGLNTIRGGVGKFKISCASEIKSVIQEYDNTSIFRFDLNNSSSFSDLYHIWEKLSAAEKNQVDYIEDPFVYNKQWGELTSLGVPLACDRNVVDAEFNGPLIFKPNIDLRTESKKNMIYSSYMGEDLGRYHAYLNLMKYGDLSLVHGLDTPNLFRGQLSIFSGENGLLKLNGEAVEAIYSRLKDLEWKNLI